MIKLTLEDNEPIWFNPNTIIRIRPLTSFSNEGSLVTDPVGHMTVREPPQTIVNLIRKWLIDNAFGSAG